MRRADIEFDPNLEDENQGQDTLIPAVAFNLAGNILEIRLVHVGFGRHIQFLTSEQGMSAKKLEQFIILFACVALWAVKISISFFLFSIVHDVHQRSRWVMYGLIGLTTLASISQGIVWGVQAQPLEKLWKPEIPGKLANPQTLVVAHITSSVFSSITDLFYALSPIYFFGGLQMSLRKKAKLLSLTGSGLLVFGTSIGRLILAKDYLNPDFTWALRRAFIFSIVERNLAQIIADLPVLAPLISITHKVKGITSRLGRGSSKANSSHENRGASGNMKSALVTIGQRSTNGNKRSAFSAYGDDRQFDGIATTCSEDEIPLRDTSDASKQNSVTQSEDVSLKAFCAAISLAQVRAAFGLGLPGTMVLRLS
ncbi:hypothetical protein DL765_010687 [Monosporascus sp. GIB2]|nr:hypothetical protein DL765_010687 [Monosporascus sp. GIB2]